MVQAFDVSMCVLAAMYTHGASVMYVTYGRSERGSSSEAHETRVRAPRNQGGEDCVSCVRRGCVGGKRTVCARVCARAWRTCISCCPGGSCNSNSCSTASETNEKRGNTHRETTALHFWWLLVCISRLLHVACSWILIRQGFMSDTSSSTSSSNSSSSSRGKEDGPPPVAKIVYRILLTVYFSLDMACVCLLWRAYHGLALYVQSVYEVGMKPCEDRDRDREYGVVEGSEHEEDLLMPAAPAAAAAPPPHTRLACWLQWSLSASTLLLLVAVICTLHSGNSASSYMQPEGGRTYAQTLLAAYAHTLYHDATFFGMYTCSCMYVHKP